MVNQKICIMIFLSGSVKCKREEMPTFVGSHLKHTNFTVSSTFLSTKEHIQCLQLNQESHIKALPVTVCQALFQYRRRQGMVMLLKLKMELSSKVGCCWLLTGEGQWRKEGNNQINYTWLRLSYEGFYRAIHRVMVLPSVV